MITLAKFLLFLLLSLIMVIA